MPSAQLALGTAQLGMPYGIANRIGQPTSEEIFSILDFAMQHKVTTWDTAPGYGASEEILGKFIANQEQMPIICTKLPSLTLAAGSECQDERLREWVSFHVSKSLQVLGIAQIDYYLVHDERDLETFGQELVGVLAELQTQGLLKTIGVSVYSPEIALEALANKRIGALQIPFNLFDHRFSDVLALAAKQRVAVFARSVFLQGLFFLNLASAQVKMPDVIPYLSELRQLANSAGRSLEELALCYVRDTLGISQLVVGVESLEQIETNVRLMDRPPLSPALRENIAQVFADVPVHIVNPSLWPRGK